VDEIFKLNEIDAEKELFFWSILTNKYELALLFWAKGKNKICKYLFEIEFESFFFLQIQVQLYLLHYCIK
jgi:hypothetical protein